MASHIEGIDLRIELTKISKSFNKNRKVLDDISLAIEDKEFCVFLGPSGCGKTTLLRIIAGLESPDAGEIYFDETLMNNVLPRDRQIGMVFQNYALYPHLNVFDNIAFPMKIAKMKKREIRSKVDRIADLLELSNFLSYKPKELSGGQRQRVALGRAIAKNPSVFLFDEPLSNLDAKLRSSMRSELVRIHKQIEATSIYVTHDQIEAMTMADKIAILNQGKIQQVATPTEIYHNPANIFVATFIGTPQINLFEGILKYENDIMMLEENHQNILTFPIMEILQNYINSKISIGVRPENISNIKTNPNAIGISALVNFIEYLGNETLIHFTYKNNNYTMRTQEKISFSENQQIQLYLDFNSFIFFNSNGNNIKGK
ncbi:MAG TPA: ABC transporter ATP-binding protein [Bacteroidota bacterium]|nr:ABC transporter ATP-binding protein [Bacteroidota bacterium]